MRNRLKTDRSRNFVPATYRGSMPGDFPVGSIQSRAAARVLITAYAEERSKEEEAELGNLTPIEQALIEDIDIPSVRIWTVRLYRCAKATEKLYGKELPVFTPEGIRHNRAVIKEIDRMTGGEASSLRMRDGPEWNRLYGIAEENLGAKKK